MAIIADDKLENTENLIMADDNTGRSITIPSFMIRKSDADRIKNSIAAGQKVYIRASLDFAYHKNLVDYQLWYSSILDLETDFLSEFVKYSKAFVNYTQFTPRIMTFNCQYCSQDLKESECLSEGRYCPYTPAGFD